MLIEQIERLDRNYITAEEAAKALGISLATFYRNKEKMNFPIIRAGRKIHIPKEPFIYFLKNGERKNTVNGYEKIVTVCYGEVQEWDSRSEAKRFFLDALLNSDGSERERYSNVYAKLQMGYSCCTDSDDA